MTEFPGGIPGIGLLWEELHTEFSAACEDVRRVNRALNSAITDLLRVVVPMGAIALTGTQRSALVRAQGNLNGKMQRFLAQADAFFMTGRRLVVSTVPSL
jgi:hypothetical protein